MKATRRRLGASAATLLASCAAPLPPLATNGIDADARALLAASATAHGAAAFADLRDVAVAFAGTWPPVIGRLAPALVDAGYRGGSEERFLPRDGILAQDHVGPAGRKYVLRRTDAVHVWLDGVPADDPERLAAAALVADGYSLFLFGPMLLTARWAADRSLTLVASGEERVTIDGEARRCDILQARLTPGLGFAPADRLALYIDRDDRLMRRVRFSIDGLDATRGAVAEVDCLDHIRRFGVQWPTRFCERLLRPLPLRVHDWRLTGLDVDRGLDAAELLDGRLAGRSAVPATRLV